MQDSTFRKSLDFIIVTIMGAGALTFGIYMAVSYPHVTVKYDCSMAEISPDYPVQVKEECRKLRAHNF